MSYMYLMAMSDVGLIINHIRAYEVISRSHYFWKAIDFEHSNSNSWCVGRFSSSDPHINGLAIGRTMTLQLVPVLFMSVMRIALYLYTILILHILISFAGLVRLSANENIVVVSKVKGTMTQELVALSPYTTRNQKNTTHMTRDRPFRKCVGDRGWR